MSQLNPLYNRVVVRKQEPETQSLGGIIIPDNVAEQPDRGTVVAVGPGLRNKDGDLIPVAVTVGEQVIFPAQAGQAIKVHGEEYLILTDDEILAVIE